jgi:hypothetical protein
MASLWFEVKRRLRNLRALQQPVINLWVDDERPVPDAYGPSFYHAISVDEARDVLTSNRVNMWSIDHDLGRGGEVYDLVKWLSRELHENGLNFWPKHYPRIHTANPVGFENIRQTVDRYGPYKAIGETVH